MKNMIFAYITCSGMDEARKLSLHLIEQNLAGCTNVFPMTSFYTWKKEIKEDSEVVLIAKTIDDKFESLKKEVEKIHSYDTPCIIRIPVEANEEYYNWLISLFSEH